MTTTKTEADGQHPPSHYLVVGDPDKASTFHLRVKDASGTVDPRLLGAAHAALTKGFRGNRYEGPDKAAALTKLRSLYKSQGLDWPDDAKSAADPLIPLSALDDLVDLILDEDDNDDDDADDDDTPTEAAEPVRADDPGMGDVHVPGALGASPQGQGKPKRSPALKRLRQRLKSRFAQQRFISADDFEADYRAAIGHAGGTARSRKAGTMGMACPPCQAGDHDDCTGGDCPCAVCETPRSACELCDCPDCSGTACGCCAECDRAAAVGLPATYTEGSPHIQTPDGDFRVFLPVRCAEAPDWIPYLPKPGMFCHPRYGDIEITAERNRDFVQKFAAGVYQRQLPLDAEHETKLSGAMAWIKAMRQNPDGSVDAGVEWTDRGRSLLAGDRYKYVSPEWYDVWTDPATGEPVDNVAIGGALTTRPFFKESSLRPLVATEAGIFVPGDDRNPIPPAPRRKESVPMTEPQSAVSTPEPAGDATAQKYVELEGRVDDLAKKLKRASEERDDLAEKNKALKKLASEAVEGAKAAAERVKALEDAARRREFAEIAKDFFGETEKHVALMERLDEEGRTAYVELQRAHAEQLRASDLFRPVGVTPQTSGGDAGEDEVEKLVASRIAAEPGLSKAQAYAKVLSENPTLYEEYRKEHPLHRV